MIEGLFSPPPGLNRVKEQISLNHLSYFFFRTANTPHGRPFLQAGNTSFALNVLFIMFGALQGSKVPLTRIRIWFTWGSKRQIQPSRMWQINTVLMWQMKQGFKWHIEPGLKCLIKVAHSRQTCWLARPADLSKMGQLDQELWTWFNQPY